MNEEQTTNITKKKNKKVLIIGLIVIVVVVSLVAVFIYASGSKDRKLKDTLQLAENYLNELDYEKAIAAYEEAIKIDPKSADAYCGLADTYVAMAENSINEGNIDKANEYYDAAIKALDEGINCVSDSDKERLETYKTKIEKAKNEMEETSVQEESVDNNDEEINSEIQANSVQEEFVDNNAEEINYEIPEEILNINLFGKDWKTYTFDSLKAEMTKGLELRIDSEGLEKYMDGGVVVVSENDNHDGYFLWASPYNMKLWQDNVGYQVIILCDDNSAMRNIGDFGNYFGKDIFDVLKEENPDFSEYVKKQFYNNESEFEWVDLGNNQGLYLKNLPEIETKIYGFSSGNYSVEFSAKENVIHQINLNYY